MTPYLTKRGGVFVAVYELRGRRMRTSTRTSDPAKAAAALGRLAAGEAAGEAIDRAETHPTKGRERTGLLALIDGWGTSKTNRRCTPGYVRNGKRIIERCVTFMHWGSLKSLTPAGIEALREKMLEHGASTGRVNSRMRYMGSWCSWLWRTGRLTSDPMVDVAPLPHDAKKRRALNVDELARLFACEGIGEEYRRVYRALFYSGLRVDIELGRLQWPQVGQDGVLRFKGKGGRDRTVPVSAALSGVLDEQRQAQAMRLNVGGLIFPRIPTPAEFEQHLALAKIPKLDARGHVASRHSLRHSWNQELTRAGVSSEQRKHLGGWADETMPTGQYQDASALGLREAMNRLPRIA